MKNFMFLTIPVCLALLTSCGPTRPPEDASSKKPPDLPSGPPPPSTVDEPERDVVPGVQKELRDIHFDFDKADIREDARSILEGNAAVIKRVSDVKIVVEGHCDERGSVEYNLALGERRARAARDYLVRLGVPAGRLQSVSYGKELPVDPGHTEEAWARNRRAHFLAVR